MRSTRRLAEKASCFRTFVLSIREQAAQPACPAFANAGHRFQNSSATDCSNRTQASNGRHNFSNLKLSFRQSDCSNRAGLLHGQLANPFHCWNFAASDGINLMCPWHLIFQEVIGLQQLCSEQVCLTILWPGFGSFRPSLPWLPQHGLLALNDIFRPSYCRESVAYSTFPRPLIRNCKGLSEAQASESMVPLSSLFLIAFSW